MLNAQEKGNRGEIRI